MTRLRARALIGLAVLGLSACASVRVRPPTGPWTADPAAVEAFEAATAACRGARTITAEIGVSGRAGDTRVRGRLLAAVERPGRLRIEAVAPFGAPIFILAGRDGRATLLLPRERRYVADADTGELLEALTGLRRSADDLLALLAGCAVADPRPASGSRNPAGWLAVGVDARATAFLRRDSGTWRLRAASHTSDDQSLPWLIEYEDFVSAFPGTIRLREGAPDGPAGPSVELTLRIAQREVNVAVDPAAFFVATPAGAAAMTLDELRQLGPLADPEPRTRTGR